MAATKKAKAKSKRKPVELPERPRLSKAHRFQPGNQMAAGKGPNKLTTDIKQGIVGAAAELGYDGNGLGGLQGYCKYLAEDYPKQFASLLARVIPLQINAAVQGAFIGQVNLMGVPTDRYLTAEQIKALQPPEDGPIIDAEPLPNDDEEAAA